MLFGDELSQLFRHLLVNNVSKAGLAGTWHLLSFTRSFAMLPT